MYEIWALEPPRGGPGTQVPTIGAKVNFALIFNKRKGEVLRPPFGIYLYA